MVRLYSWLKPPVPNRVPCVLEPPPSTIRFATRADALAIAEMSRDLIEQGLGWSWTKERVRRCLRHPDTNVVVAMREADRAGFGIMKYGEEEAHLLLLAVRAGAHAAAASAGASSTGSRPRPGSPASPASRSRRASPTSARATSTRRLGYSQAELLPGYYGGREASVRMAKELGSTQKGIA